ncbi:hypothetical protein C4D60_Mb08t13300 [Musa balbisiana]|uniref:Uncharacterized protein n=1 Tax=Musa balbisiana TaxID=52838 RepID=A0A4S8K3G2_MUSBA|nr:hypothetical protein C4D60_Mb08t13300 [Musa balbisiana]
MARRKRSGSKAQYSAVLRYYTNHTIEVPLFEARAVGKVHLCTAAPSRHTRSWVYKSRADKNASQEGETERRKERKGAEEVAVAVEGACRGEERRGGKAKEILSPVPAPPTPAVTTRFCRSRQFLFDISSTNAYSEGKGKGGKRSIAILESLLDLNLGCWPIEQVAIFCTRT